MKNPYNNSALWLLVFLLVFVGVYIIAAKPFSDESVEYRMVVGLEKFDTDSLIAVNRYQVFSTISKDDVLDAVSQIPEVSSFIIYQNEGVIAERYWRNHRGDLPLNIKSASKNVLSTLVGIAIEEGFIESIDDQIALYLTDYMRDADHDVKRDITIRHLLTMSSGLPSTSFGNYGRWVVSRDWTRAALNGELEAEPGTRMRYSTGDTHILSAVLSEATGMSTRAYAESRLFRPMGVRIGGWDRSPEDEWPYLYNDGHVCCAFFSLI
ncbi:MAG: serine hydrolase [Bacteroidetes bacterium]|nr:serine hydrolase [Bacteroidota bacterium]MCH8523971.1 beta-lactamase family protein [Balneolales bacterium]